MRATVICHAYNEAYLMPWWLEHHRRIFDHGIFIDYDSTDGTPDIVRRVCPGWEVRRSRNREFDAIAVDEEVMDVERSVDGIKVALNVTEFLLPHRPLRECFDGRDECVALRALAACCPSSDTQRPGTLVDVLSGIERVDASHRLGHRFVHTHPDGAYVTGRHWTSHESRPARDMHLLWLGFYPWNDRLQARRAQISGRVSSPDRAHRRGFQHHMTPEETREQRRLVEAASVPLADVPGLQEALARAQKLCLPAA